MDSVKFISFDLNDTLLDPRRRTGQSSSANDPGKINLYADASAIVELKRYARIGIVADASYRQLQRLQENIGLCFDFAVLSEDTGLSSHKSLFSAVRKHLGVTESDAGRHWLHVSAYAERDLLAAKEAGALTCFVPRPHANNAHEANAVKPDTMVSDLFQLHAGLVARKGHAKTMTLTFSAPHPKLVRELLRWLRQEETLPKHPRLNLQVCTADSSAELRFCGAADDRSWEALVQAFAQDLRTTFPADLVDITAREASLALEA